MNPRIFCAIVSSMIFATPNSFAKCYKRAGGSVLGNLVIDGKRAPLVEVRCDHVISNLVLPRTRSASSNSAGRLCGVPIRAMMTDIPTSRLTYMINSVLQDGAESVRTCSFRGGRGLVAVFADGEAYGYVLNR